MTSIQVIGLVLFSWIGQEIPRDTSYSLHSVYLKTKKHYPEVRFPTVEITEDIEVRWNQEYLVIGNRKLTCNVFVPKTRNHHAGILMVHGGGWNSGDKSMMTAMATFMANSGYTVVCPEYRLAPEAQYPAAVYDLKAALRWMRQNQNLLALDTSKIVLLGCSAGGQLAALVGATGDREVIDKKQTQPFSSNVQAIVDVDGVLAFRHPDSEEGIVAAAWLGGSSAEIPEIWNQASALTYVSDKTPPTLFLASKYPRFLAGRQEYTSILATNGIQVQTRFLGDAPHSFWLLNPWFDPTMNYIIEFLEEVFN